MTLSDLYFVLRNSNVCVLSRLLIKILPCKESNLLGNVKCGPVKRIKSDSF